MENQMNYYAVHNITTFLCIFLPIYPKSSGNIKSSCSVIVRAISNAGVHRFCLLHVFHRWFVIHKTEETKIVSYLNCWPNYLVGHSCDVLNKVVQNVDRYINKSEIPEYLLIRYRFYGWLHSYYKGESQLTVVLTSYTRYVQVFFSRMIWSSNKMTIFEIGKWHFSYIFPLCSKKKMCELLFLSKNKTKLRPSIWAAIARHR